MTEDFALNVTEFERVAGRLLEGGRELQKATRKVVGTAVKSTMRDVIKEGSAPMPRRGGLSERLATSKVAYYPTSDWMGLRVVLGNRRRGQLGRIDRGLLRHPVFAARSGEDRKTWKWVSQNVPAGTYTGALNHHIDDIKHAQLMAMQATVDKVAGK